MNDERDPADELRRLTDAFSRLTEPLRREVASMNRDAVAAGAGEPVRRRLDVVQSVRLSAEAATDCRGAAERMGFRGLSDLLRAAVLAAVQPTGFRCSHLQTTCGPGFISMRCGAGCDMEPAYAVTAAAAA